MASKPNNDWIEWAGGECPVDPETLVQVKLACNYGSDEAEPAGMLVWECYDSLGDIIAYRVVSA